MSVAKTLKTLRKEKGLTQEQLAKELGLSTSAIIGYENGKREPNFEAMTKIEKYFKVSSQYLKGESAYRNISEDMFFTKTLKIDGMLIGKDKNIQHMVISILNSFNHIITQTLEKDASEDYTSIHKKLSLLASVVDKINTIYYSTYLPMKDLWENGLISELEFYKKKEGVFRKHLSSIEYYFREVFSIRCSELYKEYIEMFDKMDSDRINAQDETSHEINENTSYFYPTYFENFKQLHKNVYRDEAVCDSAPKNTYLHEDQSTSSYLPVIGKTAAGSPIEILEYNHGKINAYGKYVNAFVIQVSGDSMIDAGIADGDYAVIKPQPEVENGEIALIEVDGSSTIKYFYKFDNIIELRPANSRLFPMTFDPKAVVRIKGKVVDILKKRAAEEMILPSE
jgi:SOS-response transcriptional repressor LexA